MSDDETSAELAAGQSADYGRQRPSDDETPRWVGLALMVAVLLVVVAGRAPYHPWAVLDLDEGVYFTMAQGWLRGAVPYVTLWDHKTPGLYLALMPGVALAELAGPPSVLLMRVYTTGWLAVTCAAVYALGRRWLRPVPAALAALVYGLLFRSFGGLASNAELFFMLPVVLALYAYAQFSGDGRWWWLLVGGVLASVAVWIKPPAVFSAGLVAVLLAWRYWQQPATLARWLGIWLGGTLLPALLIGLYFVGARGFNDLLGMFAFNNGYVATRSVMDAARGLVALLAAVLPNPLVWLSLTLGAWLAVEGVLRWLKVSGGAAGDGGQESSVVSAGRACGALGLLFVLSLVGVMYGRWLFPHYWLQMALPLALISGAGIGRLGVADGRLARVTAVAVVLLLGGTLAQNAVRARGDVMFTGGYHAGNALAQTVDWLRTEMGDDTTLFVNGHEPVVYFLSGREPAGRFFLSLFWEPRYDALLGSEAEMLALWDERGGPDVVVVVEDHSPLAAVTAWTDAAGYGEQARFGPYVVLVR